MGRGSIRNRARGVIRALAAAGAAWLLLGCGPPELSQPVALSLLALGDTGARPDDPPRVSAQLAVGEALGAEDARLPIDALLLLGDLFYDEGLREDELVARVSANLVRPYCRFLALTAPRSPEVANACGVPAAERHPVPLYALLGNHDYATPGSVELERKTVPLFIANWRMQESGASVAELGQGVSLVLFESDPVFRGAAPEGLAGALRAAAGPWRILAAHQPIAVVGTSEREAYASFRARVLAEIAAAGVPVQLYVSGHEHNLQVLGMEPPAPPLHVVSGGGSGARSLHDVSPHRWAGLAAAGYVRIDLAGEGDAQRLVVSLMRVPAAPLRVFGPSRLAARFSVDRAGRVREE
jgi:3',5'-cyclic AMP phosphodiesterase CpdA